MCFFYKYRSSKFEICAGLCCYQNLRRLLSYAKNTRTELHSQTDENSSLRRTLETKKNEYQAMKVKQEEERKKKLEEELRLKREAEKKRKKEEEERKQKEREKEGESCIKYILV